MWNKIKTWSEGINLKKELKQNDFFYLIENYFKINNIEINWEDIDKFIWVFLKDENNRYKIEEYLINNNELNNDSLKYNLKILSDVDNFYKGLSWKNPDYPVINNIDFKKTEEEINLEESWENIVKTLIQEWNIINRVKYVLENDISLKLGYDKWMLAALDFFRLKINNSVKIFTKELNQIDGKDLLLMMNAWKDNKIKNLDFDYFSDWHIVDIISFENFYWKKIINIKYINSNDFKRKIHNCFLTDDGEILNLKGKYYIRKLFWEIDVLWKKFVWAWITSKFQFMIDLNNNPIVIWKEYLKNFKDLKLKKNWISYVSVNDWSIIIPKNKFKEIIDKYVSFDTDKKLIEVIYE